VQSSSQIIITNKPTSSFFTGRMPFLSPNQQCQSTEGKILHFMDLHTPTSPGVFQLCLWPLVAPGYLGGGLPCLSSDLWCQYPFRRNRPIKQKKNKSSDSILTVCIHLHGQKHTLSQLLKSSIVKIFPINCSSADADKPARRVQRSDNVTKHGTIPC